MGRELTRSVLGVPFLRERAMEAETRRALEAGGTRIPSLRTAVEHLSGGQRQAIELNRFVHWGGKLVMLDEPFAALGVEQTRRGLETVDRVRRRGIGVMIITHVMAQAFAVADRIVVLRHGTVAGDLRTEDDQPRRGRAPDHRRHRTRRTGAATTGRTDMRRIWQVAAVAVLGVALAATGAFAQSKGKIYYLVPTLIDEFQTGSIDAITKFMGDVGYEVVSLDGQNRSDLQLNQVDDVLNLAAQGGDPRRGRFRRDQAGHREAARRRHPGDDLRPADHLDAVATSPRSPAPSRWATSPATRRSGS